MLGNLNAKTKRRSDRPFDPSLVIGHDCTVGLFGRRSISFRLSLISEPGPIVIDVHVRLKPAKRQCQQTHAYRQRRCRRRTLPSFRIAVANDLRRFDAAQDWQTRHQPRTLLQQHADRIGAHRGGFAGAKVLDRVVVDVVLRDFLISARAHARRTRQNETAQRATKRMHAFTLTGDLYIRFMLLLRNASQFAASSRS